MTPMDVYNQFKSLTREDQITLSEMIRNHLARAAVSMYPGDKVKFTTRDGITIVGTLLKLTSKNAKISANSTKHGPSTMPVMWTVSRQLVVNA